MLSPAIAENDPTAGTFKLNVEWEYEIDPAVFMETFPDCVVVVDSEKVIFPTLPESNVIELFPVGALVPSFVLFWILMSPLVFRVIVPPPMPVAISAPEVTRVLADGRPWTRMLPTPVANPVSTLTPALIPDPSEKLKP